jgi:hypothetical protein
MKLIGGAHMAVTEGEGVVAGVRKLEEETTFGKYAKAAQAGMRGWMGRLAAGPIGPKVKEKFVSE